MRKLLHSRARAKGRAVRLRDFARSPRPLVPSLRASEAPSDAGKSARGVQRIDRDVGQEIQLDSAENRYIQQVRRVVDQKLRGALDQPECAPRQRARCAWDSRGD